MRVALTGSTGLIGSHVLSELLDHGHEVRALVRDDAQAVAVAAKGAKATVLDLYDRPAVSGVLKDCDGAIHTASPGDVTSADLDSAVLLDAAIDAFDGTGKPYLQLGGLWVYGNNSSISEDSPFKAPAWCRGRSFRPLTGSPETRRPTPNDLGPPPDPVEEATFKTSGRADSVART